MKTFKNIQIKIQLFSLIIIVLVASVSCTGKKQSDERVQLSESGIALAGTAIKTYDDLNAALRNQTYDNEMVRILTDPSPATYMMQLNTVNSKLINDNIKKQAAFGLYKKAFLSYNLFLDKNFDYKSAHIQNRMFAATTALDSFRVNDYFTERVQMLKKQISGTRFNEQTAMLQLSLLYADLWNAELEKIYQLFETNLEQYQKGINEISNSSFDKAKVAKLIDKPYSNAEVLVNLYKLQLVNEKEKKTELLSEKIKKVSYGFEYLTELIAELSKRRKDKEKIHFLNEKLNTLLEY